MNYLNTKNSVKGFTILELMVSVGLITFLASLSATGYAAMRENMQLQNSTNEVRETIQLAQNKAMSAEAGESAGICFDYNKKNYYLVRGTDCRNILSSFALPGNIYFSELPPDHKIIFAKLTGESSYTNTFTLSVYSGEEQVQFKMNSNGLSYE